MTQERFRQFVAGIIAILIGAAMITTAELIPSDQEWLSALGGGLIGISLILLFGALRR